MRTRSLSSELRSIRPVVGPGRSQETSSVRRLPLGSDFCPLHRNLHLPRGSGVLLEGTVVTSAEEPESAAANRRRHNSTISRPGGAAIPSQRRGSTSRPPRGVPPAARAAATTTAASAEIQRLTDLARAGG